MRSPARILLHVDGEDARGPRAHGANGPPAQRHDVALDAYSAAGQGNVTGRELSNPKVKSVIDSFREKVDHTEGSTGRLTQKCFVNPVECDFFFTYESRIPDIEKQIPGAIMLYNDRVIQADQVVLVTTTDPAQREAADYLVSLVHEEGPGSGHPGLEHPCVKGVGGGVALE